MKQKALRYEYCIRYYNRRKLKEFIISDKLFKTRLEALSAAEKEIRKLFNDKCKLYELRVIKKHVTINKLRKSKQKLDLRENEIFVEHGCYIRYNKKYSIEDVLNQYNLKDANFDGDIIDMTSQRYANFKFNGTICKCCGVEGKYFYKERHTNDKSYHFNLYGIDKNGNEVLMTKDHILAKSKGGKDDINNYQCLCEKCNSKKGSLSNEEFMKNRGINNENIN